MDAVQLADRMNAHKVRVYPNPYPSAQEACDVWTNWQLWGNPIKLDKKKLHVYGVYLRNWSIVYVEFTDRYIMVVKPPASGNGSRGSGKRRE